MDQERAIEFILDQQAKLAAGFVELQSGLNDLRSIVTTVAGVQQGFGQALLQTQQQLQLTQDQLQRTNEQVSRLAEAQLHTDERLNTLITIVDGIIRRLPPQ